MAITDYIPNVFGSSVPSTYESLQTMGLLTPQQVEQQQKTANIQGLLGAGLALAQGMSRTGPRRSAAENILGALAGGFGAAGGAYQQGLQNVVQRQQLQSAALQQQQAANKLKSIEAAKLKYPDLAPLADIDSGKFAEEVALKERMGGVFGSQTGPQTPESLRSQAQRAYIANNKPLGDSLIEMANRLEVEGRLRPQAPTAGVQQPTQEVPVEAAPGSLPVVTVVGQQGPDAQLLSRKNQLLAANQSLATVVSKEARDTIKANSDEIAAIDKQLDRYAASDYNFDAVEELVPPQFKGMVRSLKNRAQTGSLSLADISRDIANIESKAIEFVTKKTDFTNQDRRVFGGMFPNADGTPRAIETATPVELMQLENKLYQMRVSERKAGAPVTNVNLPSESERTAGYLTTRIKNSLAQLQAAVGETPSAASPNFRAELIKFVTNSNYLKNLANPEARQRVEAAQLDILDAALTLATGAAYTREQLESTRETYFPTLGDKPATIRDKANRLDQLLRDAAITKSGRAAPSLDAPAFSATDLQNAVNAELERRKGKK